jgi:L-2-hydroxyglutarate oxidase LhgO
VSAVVERIGTAIIGGGAVGCAIAFELAKNGHEGVFLLEQQARVGEEQSGRNSGVVHAGIYYPTGSLKAELCVEANPLVYEFCREHSVACEKVGKLVVASSDAEVAELDATFQQAKQNGVPGARMLTSAEVRSLEPNVAVTAAIHTPTTGIFDAATYTATLARLAREHGAEVLTSFEITHVEALSGGGFGLRGVRGDREERFEAETLINSAGLYSDVIARMVNPAFGPVITPLRGEYYQFNRRRRDSLWLNGFNIYPVPTMLDIGGESLKMVGAHLTPTFAMTRSGATEIGDIVTVGPEFVRVSSPTDFEAGRKRAEFFLEQAGRFFPGLELADLQLGFTGIMASRTGGSDFIIERDAQRSDCIQLVGIDSPGLTSSLAIARRVQRMLR